MVKSSSDDTRARIDQDISALITLKANEIGNYFYAKGQIIHSVFANPAINNWFAKYHSRGSDLSLDPGYQQLVDYFQFFSEQDKEIKSVFFGSANTFEYFDLNGRYDGDPDYYTNKRPWWQEAIDRNGLFVGDPAVDANDGSISATVKTVVKDANGRLIGIGGMDILIDTIGKNLLAPIKYRGEGQAFLMTEQGKLVYFPGFNQGFPAGSDAAVIDNLSGDNQGFSELKREMQTRDAGIAEVTYQGELQRVSYIAIRGDYPKVRWYLGFMLPNEVFQAPVKQSLWQTSLVSVGIILLVALTVFLMMLPFRRNLNSLLHTMEDIAEGEGDLSRRIEINRADELGRLGAAFNRFAAKVQSLLLETRELSGRWIMVLPPRLRCVTTHWPLSAPRNRKLPQWPQPLPKWPTQARRWRPAPNEPPSFPRRRCCSPETAQMWCSRPVRECTHFPLRSTRLRGLFGRSEAAQRR